jgi:RNA polymerase sigma-54 factor
MSIEIKQHLKLSQQLVMTPQLQQAIKLLQLSRMELVDMVRDEMLENPILEDTVESANEQARPPRRPPRPTATAPTSSGSARPKRQSPRSATTRWTAPPR